MQEHMDFLQMAKSRYSVRAYKNRKVEPEKLEKILLAAQAAPTAANLQPVRLIAVQEDEGLRKIGKAANIYGATRLPRVPLSFCLLDLEL